MINDINNSGKGLAAALDSNGNLVVTDSQNRSVSATGADALTDNDRHLHHRQWHQLQPILRRPPEVGQALLAVTNPHQYQRSQGGGSTIFTANTGDTTVTASSSPISTSSATSGLVASVTSNHLFISDAQHRGTSGNPLAMSRMAGLRAIGGGDPLPRRRTPNGAVFSVANTTNASTFSTYLSDSTTTGSSSISVNMTTLSASGLGLSGQSLTSQGVAQTALTAVNVAVSQISSLRGNLGAAMNRLTAATNVMNNQVQNLSNAQDGITAADIGKEVANMTKFNVLQQTGIAALQQANQAQQSILKLLQ